MTEQPPGESGAGTIRIVETDYIPPCPHCRKPLREIRKNLSRGAIQYEAIYSCPECGEMIGIGYGRGND
jgi:hypothetical protein